MAANIDKQWRDSLGNRHAKLPKLKKAQKPKRVARLAPNSITLKATDDDQILFSKDKVDMYTNAHVFKARISDKLLTLEISPDGSLIHAETHKVEKVTNHSHKPFKQNKLRKRHKAKSKKRTNQKVHPKNRDYIHSIFSPRTRRLPNGDIVKSAPKEIKLFHRRPSNPFNPSSSSASSESIDALQHAIGKIPMESQEFGQLFDDISEEVEAEWDYTWTLQIIIDCLIIAIVPVIMYHYNLYAAFAEYFSEYLMKIGILSPPLSMLHRLGLRKHCDMFCRVNDALDAVRNNQPAQITFGVIALSLFMIISIAVCKKVLSMVGKDQEEDAVHWRESDEFKDWVMDNVNPSIVDPNVHPLHSSWVVDNNWDEVDDRLNDHDYNNNSE